VIRVRGLRKVFPGNTIALDEIDLEIAAGEVVALIGPSGAGKSTFLRCLNGLVTPTAGEVRVGEARVSGAVTEELRRVRAGIGFVFQQFNLLRRLTVLENVLVGRLARVSTLRSLLALFPASDVARARAALERVDLGGLGDRRVDTLSGDSSSGSPSPAPSCKSLASSSPTSRWPAWTPRSPTACSRCCAGSAKRTASRW
jgi:phosphonate transport system ATP-binding protein